jgi:hypothetical protein
MHINTSVSLDADDQFAWTPDQAAAQVLAALGGNATKDFCLVTLTHSEAGQAGAPPIPEGAVDVD